MYCLSLLSKVLKGSREKKVLELGLDASPAYGALRELKLEQVLARIDWVILNGYLRIEHDLLDRIEAAGERRYAPALQQWAPSASRKVRAHIEAVLRALR